MEQKKGKTSSPLSAGCDAGRCKKTADSPQAEKEKLNEDKNESLYKNQGTQIEYEKFSEECVQDELPRKSVSSLPHNSSSLSPSSLIDPQYYRSWCNTLPSPLSLLRTKLISSAQYMYSNVSLQCQQSIESSGLSYNQLLSSWSPVCSSKTRGEVWEKRDQVLSTTVHRDSDIQHSVMSVALSKHSYKMTYNSPCSAHPSNMTYLQQSRFLKRFNVSERGSRSFLNPPSFFHPSTYFQSITPSDMGPLYPEKGSVVPQESTYSTGESLKNYYSIMQHNLTEHSPPVDSHLQQPSDSFRGCYLPSLYRMSSLSQITSAKNKTFTRSNSSPVMLKTSFEEFTPDITADEDDETYRFQCSCPGLYQCSVTGLVFHMEGEGDVVYRIVPWNRRLLVQHHKQPAGPLFDIKCLQQSVRQLHLPHCEIRSTGGCDFLSVAHVNDEGIEFIGPHKITETHVVINITGFSGFGNVKDEDSAPDPVRALVLLFYRPPADPDLESLLNVLLLPRNVVLWDVLHTRKKLVGDESYIDTSPLCKLHPKQEYTLSTCPEDSVRVQPRKAEFDSDNYGNYFPSFQVKLKTIIINIELFLSDTNTSHIAWESEVCLSSTGVKRSCGPSALNLPPDERLFDIRISFIDRVSGPVLQSLLDKLFEKKVMTDSERESADQMQNRRDKACFVIDTVRKKGEAASSEMIEFLCEADPFLSKHLGLI